MEEENQSQVEESWKRFKRHAHKAYDGLKDTKEKNREDFRFATGKDQWPEVDLEILERTQRGGMTINHIHRVIQTVAGNEIQNRYEPRFVRRTEEDGPGNELLNAVYRFHREESSSRHEDSLVFRNALTCGWGVSHTFMDYTNDPEGIITTEATPNNQFAWDPDAKKQDCRDRKFNYRAKKFTKEEFRKIFNYSGTLPGEGVESLVGEKNDIGDMSTSWMYLPEPEQWFDHDSNEVMVIEHEYRTLEDAQIFVLPDNSTDFAFSDEWDFIADRYLAEYNWDINQTLVSERPVPMNRYHIEQRAGNILLSSQPSIYRDFTYQMITCFGDVSEDMTKWYGLVHVMRDPQIWTNKLFSQILHIIATNPKGAVISGPGTFKNPDKAKEDWSKPGGFIEAQVPNIKESIMHLPPPKAPEAAFSMLQYCSSLPSELVAVNMNVLGGQVEDLKRTSGTVFNQAAERAVTSIGAPFDSFTRYRRNIGRLFLQFLREHGNPERMVRIAGEPYARYGQLAQSNMFLSYDVVIGDEPISTGSAQEMLKSLTDHGGLQFMLGADLMPPWMAPDFIELPEHKKQEMREYIIQRYEMAQQAQMQAAQAGV